MSETHDILRVIERIAALLRPEFGGGAGAADAAEHRSDLEMARVRLRRAALEPDRGPVSLAQLVELATGLPEPVGLDVTGLEPSMAFPGSTGRIVCSLLLMAAESLPDGGTVSLAGVADDLFVRITGPGAVWPAGLALCVTDETAARAALVQAGSLQMALTAVLAHACDVRLSLLLPPVNRDEPAILRLGGGGRPSSAFSRSPRDV